MITSILEIRLPSATISDTDTQRQCYRIDVVLTNDGGKVLIGFGDFGAVQRTVQHWIGGRLVIITLVNRLQNWQFARNVNFWGIQVCTTCLNLCLLECTTRIVLCMWWSVVDRAGYWRNMTVHLCEMSCFFVCETVYDWMPSQSVSVLCRHRNVTYKHAVQLRRNITMCKDTQ